MSGRKPIGFNVTIRIEPDESGFHAYSPTLKGLHTCGETEEKALYNAKLAAKAYLTSSLKHGDPIPLGIIVYEESEEHISRNYRTEDLLVSCTI